MPTDDPFNSNEPVSGPVHEDSPSTGAMPDMAAALEQATAPLKQTIESLNQQLFEAEQARNRPAPLPVEEIGEEEFAEGLYATPQAAVQQEFQRQAAPLVATMADQIAETNYDKERSRIDAEWGQGAFDAVIDKELRPIIDEAKQFNPQGLLNRTMFTNAVDTLAGRNARKLMEHHSTHSESQQQRELEAAAKLKETVLADVTPNLAGGIRRSAAGAQAELPDQQKEYLRDMFKADGVQRDERSLAALQGAEVRTLEDYRRVQEQLKEQK